MRSNGSASELEAVRRRAVRLVLDGQTQAAVAVALGVHSVTVAKWMAKHRAEGEAGLVAKPTPGRPMRQPGKPPRTPPQNNNRQPNATAEII